MKKQRGKNSSQMHCVYTQGRNGFVTSCGFRAAGFNKYWKVCPFCTKPIVNLGKDTKEFLDEEN